MDIKNDAEKVVKIVKDFKNESNKNLMFALDFIKNDFDHTKETILSLTDHLDKLENTYNTLHEELKKRINNV